MRFHVPVLIAMAATASLLPWAIATAGDVLPDTVLACRDEADDAQRLACYDREVRRHATTPEQRFGLRQGQPSAAASEELRTIAATITGISRRARGEYLVTLDNGQVWAQTQAGSTRLEVGDRISIRTAAFGSYLLTSPRGGTTRVARVK